MRLWMKVYFLFFLMISSWAEKQLLNEETDILLEYFGIGYKASNSTDIPIMGIKNKSMSVSGLRLGDISTLRRLSDVVLETTPSGDTRVSGVFGLEKFQLKITHARLNDYEGPAVVTSKNNSADVAYTIQNPGKAHSCRMSWERFRLGEFSEMRVTTPEASALSQNDDVAPTFNKRILPALNHHFNTPQFLSTLSKTFDFCTYKRYLFPL